jgi:hypothetical protein
MEAVPYLIDILTTRYELVKYRFEKEQSGEGVWGP